MAAKHKPHIALQFWTFCPGYAVFPCHIAGKLFQYGREIIGNHKEITGNGQQITGNNKEIIGNSQQIIGNSEEIIGNKAKIS